MKPGRYPGGGVGQRAGLSAAPDRQHPCDPKAQHQATPPGEALAPPVGDPLAGSPVGATDAGVLGSTASRPEATAAAAAAARLRAAHPRAVRPAPVSRLAAIARHAGRLMNEAGPVIHVLAAGAPLATFPLLLTALLVVAYALVQRWIDRGDPRLASNAAPEPILPFT